MRRRLTSVLLTCIMTFSASSMKVSACDAHPFLRAETTAYTLVGYTKSGQYTRDGICASGNPDYFGKTIKMYKRLPDGSVGDLIGIYECLDTGCHPNVIDVWCGSEESTTKFINTTYEDGCSGRVYIQVINAVG